MMVVLAKYTSGLRLPAEPDLSVSCMKMSFIMHPMSTAVR